MAEILPLESADMLYKAYYDSKNNLKYEPVFTSTVIPLRVDIPCWSLAALLEIIKKLVGYSLQSLDTYTVFMNCELGDKPYNIETKNYDNPVDACYEMIMRLNELKLL